MHLNVFFTPAEIVTSEARLNDIYIVIDVIRATTTITVMFDQGATRVLAAANIEQARTSAQLFPGRVLCGERNVMPGTRAFYACPARSVRLAGSLYNAQAVTAYALTLAQERDCNIALVCSGESGYFALDDAVCAGYLSLALQTGLQRGQSLQLHESAHAAIALYYAYTPPKVLEHSNSAASVIQAGLQVDADFCMQVNQSQSVAMVVGREEETGLLILEKCY